MTIVSRFDLRIDPAGLRGDDCKDLEGLAGFIKQASKEVDAVDRADCK